MPDTAETAPNMELSSRYRDKLALMVFAAAAGVTTKKPTSKVPVICMPIATVNETSSKYKRLVRATLIPFEVASSSEISPKTILR